MVDVLSSVQSYNLQVQNVVFYSIFYTYDSTKFIEITVDVPVE